MTMLKAIGLLVALMALVGCINGQPPMSRVTRSGQPCHTIGYSFAPVWVGPDNSTVCTP
jgi:hypothetical protein